MSLNCAGLSLPFCKMERVAPSLPSRRRDATGDAEGAWHRARLGAAPRVAYSASGCSHPPGRPAGALREARNPELAAVRGGSRARIRGEEGPPWGPENPHLAPSRAAPGPCPGRDSRKHCQATHTPPRHPVSMAPPNPPTPPLPAQGLSSSSHSLARGPEETGSAGGWPASLQQSDTRPRAL